MVLDINNCTINYIAIDYYCNKGYWDDTYVNKVTLQDYIRLTEFGKQPENINYRYTYLNYDLKENISPAVSKGVFLGNAESLRIQIAKKQNPANISTFKKVYFDSACKYPRFKLSTLTNIKRCLDPAKADSVIISEPCFNDYCCKANSLKHVNISQSSKVLILFSSKNNCYYFIDHYPKSLNRTSEDQKFQTLIRSYADPNTEGLYFYASALINSSILPSDCVEFYYGNVIMITNTEDLGFFHNIFTKYMLITYDTDLDRFISNGLQNITTEDLETLGRMFSSSDSSVVSMGIKLLSNYDILPSACALGSLIMQNWRTISQSPTFTSIGFKQVLNTLKLDPNTLRRGDTDYAIDTLYSVSSNDLDKENTRNMMKEELIRLVKNNWENNLSKKFPSMNFTFNFTIE